jgi:hypothetical protein
VKDTTETIPPHNVSVTGCRRRWSRSPCLRWSEGQRAMWPMPVVMIDERLEDPLQVLLVENQQAVETL